jgi:hypothetical protein
MSTLRVDNISDRAGTGFTNIPGQARAWVNFNGTGTVAIRAQYNVSSITDNGTGNYTVNFTTAMPDANYAVAGNCKENTTDNTRSNRVVTMWRTPNLITSVRIGIVNFSSVSADDAEVYAIIYR